MSELTKESFGILAPKVQRFHAQKVAAWFCVMESLNPYFIRNQEEVDTIKIILRKFIDGEFKENNECTFDNLKDDKPNSRNQHSAYQ